MKRGMGSSGENRERSLDGIPLVRTAGLTLVMNTSKGRGVFAQRPILANTLLEICPVLVLDPRENEEHVRRTDLYNYTYNWPYQNCKGAGSPSMTQAVVFGIGSLFNHSRRRQNVGWKRDIPNKLVIYKTLRDVMEGEELCISYGDRLTFKDVDDACNESGDEDDGGLGKIELI